LNGLSFGSEAKILPTVALASAEFSVIQRWSTNAFQCYQKMVFPQISVMIFRHFLHATISNKLAYGMINSRYLQGTSNGFFCPAKNILNNLSMIKTISFFPKLVNKHEA